MLLLEDLFENSGEGKGNELVSFNPEDSGKMVLTRTNLGVKVANEVLDKENDKERIGRKYAASSRGSKKHEERE